MGVTLGCNRGTWTLGLAPWWGQPAVAPPPVDTSPSGVQRHVPDHGPRLPCLGLDPVTTRGLGHGVCRGGVEAWAAEVQLCLSLLCEDGPCLPARSLHPSTEDSPLSCGCGQKERGCLRTWGGQRHRACCLLPLPPMAALLQFTASPASTGPWHLWVWVGGSGKGAGSTCPLSVPFLPCPHSYEKRLY